MVGRTKGVVTERHPDVCVFVHTHNIHAASDGSNAENNLTRRLIKYGGKKKMLASRTVFLHRDAHVVKTLPAGLAPLVT